MKMFCAICLLCVLSASCEYKDLCYDHNHWANVRIVFDWQHAPEAITKATTETTGAGMTVLFYDDETATSHEPVRYDLPGREGGNVRLLPGTYQALSYNYDTETILYRGMELENTLEAYTRLSSIGEGTMMSRTDMPRANNTEQEPVILEPDPLWAATSETFMVNIGDETRTVTMQPQTRVCEITITIHNVPNLQYSSQFGGALSGLAPSVWMASGQIGEGTATQAFSASAIDQNTLEMHFRTFGHCPRRGEGITNPHILTIYAILADGSKWYYTYDVSQQMHNPKQNPDDHHVYIELDDLPVPKPIVNGSGFQPTIDGWQGVEIEVDM